MRMRHRRTVGALLGFAVAGAPLACIAANNPLNSTPLPGSNWVFRAQVTVLPGTPPTGSPGIDFQKAVPLPLPSVPPAPPQGGFLHPDDLQNLGPKRAESNPAGHGNGEKHIQVLIKPEPG
jgi:hypothetical protein